MTWDRNGLAKKAFFYDENIWSRRIPSALYPSHVEALRSSMLDFSCLVPGHRSDGDKPDGFQLDVINTQWQNGAPDHALVAAKRAQNEAGRLDQGGFAEKAWASFFETEFFKPLSESTSVLKADSRRYVKFLLVVALADANYPKGFARQLLL